MVNVESEIIIGCDDCSFPKMERINKMLIDLYYVPKMAVNHIESSLISSLLC